MSNEDRSNGGDGIWTRVARHVADPRRWLDPGTVPAAWAVWAVVLVVTVAMGVAKPDRNSVTGNYRAAADAYIDRTPMYREGGDGWLYPPSSAVAFVPFAMPARWIEGRAGLAVSEGLWRAFCAGLLAWSVWRLSRVPKQLGWPAGAKAGVWGGQAGDLFFVMTLLTIPASLGSLQNGQSNVPMAAAFALTAAATAERRWWAAAVWAVVALLCKPSSVVLLLLVGAVHPWTVGWRLGVMLVGYVAMPLALLDWSYAVELTRQGVSKVLEAGEFVERRFADAVGAVETVVGARPPAPVMTGVRLAAAAATLGLCWWAARRLGPARAAVAMLALSASYVLLMSPRTEGVSYVLLGPPVALLAGWTLLVERRRAMGWTLVVVATVVLGAAHVLLPPKDYVLRPLGAAVVWGVVAWRVCGAGGARGPRDVGTLGSVDARPMDRPT